MNTNEVGGAERSLVHQLATQNHEAFTYFIPRLSESIKLESFIRAQGFTNIRYYDYPAAIYSFSRTQTKMSLKNIWSAFNLLFKTKLWNDEEKFQSVYLNGNKAAFLFFAQNLFSKFEGKVIWHLRDYYYNSKKTNAIWTILTAKMSGQLSFVCNSNSVKQSLDRSPWRNNSIDVIYNPVGETLNVRDTRRSVKTIGVVSMMAPWKGVHEMVLWTKLFEDQLKDLGVEKVKIYGADIYKTSGEHSSYTDQLRKLAEKFPSEILSFEGNKEPEILFNEIDCLIHYSLKPEPFGRVILEAFEAGIPVISTCLGGAAELVQSQETGLKVFPYDRRGLFAAVEQLTSNNVKTYKLIAKGLEKSKDIQEKISSEMTRVLDIEEAS